jgi:hypothetical protein
MSEKREKLTVALDPAVLERLGEKARQLDITPASLARHVISQWARSGAPLEAAA